MRNSRKSIKRPAKGTLCVVSSEKTDVYREINKHKHVCFHVGSLTLGERVVYVHKQAGRDERVSYHPLTPNERFVWSPQVEVYDDYDWFLTRFGVVLVSRTDLSLDT